MGGEIIRLPFFVARLAAHVSNRETPNPPGSGNDMTEGKGVHREVESEGNVVLNCYFLERVLKIRERHMGNCREVLIFVVVSRCLLDYTMF